MVFNLQFLHSYDELSFALNVIRYVKELTHADTELFSVILFLKILNKK